MKINITILSFTLLTQPVFAETFIHFQAGQLKKEIQVHTFNTASDSSATGESTDVILGVGISKINKDSYINYTFFIPEAPSNTKSQIRI